MTEGAAEGAERLGRLLHLLDLEEIDANIFRGANPSDRPGDRVFGGQVAAQALRAAMNTVDPERGVHSLHGYFLRPGRVGQPIVYHVDRIRDGRSFTTRRAIGVQRGEAIFTIGVSFHNREEGAEYQQPRAADAPEPDDVAEPDDSMFSAFRRMMPFEMRELGPTAPDESGFYRSTRRVWLKTSAPLPDDPGLHACVMTYMSDMGAIMAARVPSEEGSWQRMMGASLDHAMWFHRPVRADEWLFYDLQAVSTSSSRGLVRGTMHTRDGVLGLSVTQEALIRSVPRGGGVVDLPMAER